MLQTYLDMVRVLKNILINLYIILAEREWVMTESTFKKLFTRSNFIHKSLHVSVKKVIIKGLPWWCSG